MRRLALAACCLLALCAPAAVAQPAPTTDIVLMALPGPQAAPAAAAARNVTNRPGYDNQPFFLPDGRLLYVSQRDGQTDVYRFDPLTTRTERLTATPESEYSPTPMPDGGISVVRVEADGTQRLWRFGAEGGEATLLLPGVQPVGYHAWADAATLVLFVLGEPPTLQRVALGTGRADTLARDIGRSLHRIPGTNAVSYVQKGAEPWSIMRFDPATGAHTRLAPTLPGQEDHAWTPDGRLLMAEGAALSVWDAEGRSWRRLADLAPAGITRITRLAVSPDGRLIALVVDRP